MQSDFVACLAPVGWLKPVSIRASGLRQAPHHVNMCLRHLLASFSSTTYLFEGYDLAPLGHAC